MAMAAAMRAHRDRRHRPRYRLGRRRPKEVRGICGRGRTFTPRVKEALAYPVRSHMEERRLRIPFDKHIRADLRSVTKQVTAAGNVRFTAERTPDGHADRFWALALALQAASTPGGSYGYRPASKPAGSNDDEDRRDRSIDFTMRGTL